VSSLQHSALLVSVTPYGADRGMGRQRRAVDGLADDQLRFQFCDQKRPNKQSHIKDGLWRFCRSLAHPPSNHLNVRRTG
jgi:hypothetical protein